ncbi:MAG: phosphoglucosamine mutase [Acidobacteriota bacterium]
MKLETTKKLFGTDGIRGEAGKFPLDPQTVRIIGRSLARRLAERNEGRPARLVVGRDTRESGLEIERELIAGARESGAQVQSAEIITTPGIAFLARTLPADAGVVISASHNPYQDNGIKVFDPSGRKLDEDSERRIEEDIAGLIEEVSSSRPVSQSGLVSQAPAELRRRYLDYLGTEVARDLSLRGLSMVIDCANGAASEIAPKLFDRLGASVVAINNHPDGRNINHECGSLHIQGLQDRIAEEHADVGVAFDGDADRALFVDSNGKFVDGDATMWALANYLKDHGELSGDIVIATVMSNIGLEIALRSRGIGLTRTDVGDKYVLEELIRSGASLGGEQSGHIIFPRLSFAGDGMITTIGFLRAMRDQNKSLAELTEGFRGYPQVLVNVRVREKRPFKDLLAVRNLASEIEQSLGDQGRLLLRYSGTEALARVMIEGKNQSEVEAQANALAQAIESELG